MPRTPVRLRLRAATAAIGLLALAACGGDDDAPPPPPVEPTAAERCTALVTTAALPATTLTAVHQADGAAEVNGVALAAHCLVEGKSHERTGVDGKAYAIGFRMRLPDDWNGRLIFEGGGGNDGSLRPAVGPNIMVEGAMAPALQAGWATVHTDGGHTGGSGADFATDPQARIDHAYNAYDVTAVNAKAILATRYGRGPDHSYFNGCSGGGRQGMMFTQRFPTYFDGVVVHAPAMRVSSGATIAAMWNNIRFTEIAPLEGGQPILSRALSNGDLALVSTGILQACDALDGAVDGMVQHFSACRFDPAVLQCAGAKDDSCLSPAQVGALQALFDGPRNSAGERLYVGQVADPGIDQFGWRIWALGTSTTATPDSLYNLLMADALRWEFFWPSDPSFDILAFDFDIDPLRMQAESSIYDTYADDQLTGFRAHGGKLMFLHGLADPIFSAHDTADYFERLAANHGGLDAVQDFSRFFPIPGETHCGGGRATDIVDALTPMVRWVEEGVAPAQLDAAAAANHPYFPGRTRPLCPYPQVAMYRGSGSLEDAANFECRVP